MRIFTRFVMVVCAAALGLALIASSAFASRAIEIRPNREAVTATARGVIFEGGTIRITCEVTLRGALTKASVAKAAARRLPEGEIAKITEGRALGPRGERRCPSNEPIEDVTVLANAAGREFILRYDSFAGTLPEITAVNLTVLRIGFQIRLLVRCLYGGEAAVRAPTVREAGGRRTVETIEFPTTRFAAVIREFGCPAEGTLRAVNFTLSPRLTLALI
jgi:hypothetical protein